MANLVDLADRLWRGIDKTSAASGHPMAGLNTIEEVAPGVAFYKDFSNLAVVKTTGGLVLLGTGSFNAIFQTQTFAKVRSWSPEPIHTAIYSHGHVDHAYGLPPFLKEAAAKRWAPPRIVSHQAVLNRMRRYTRMAGWNSAINSRQFSTNAQRPRSAAANSPGTRDPSLPADGAVLREFL